MASPSRYRLLCALVTTTALLSSHLSAQTGTVTIGLGPSNAASTPPAPPACNLQLIGPGPLTAGNPSCPFGLAGVTLDAHATAPTVFDPANPFAYQLAHVGVLASVTPEVRSAAEQSIDFNNGVLPNALVTSAFATFEDYLQLSAASANIAALHLTFDLTGAVSVSPLLQSVATVDLGYRVVAQNGVMYADGSFGSFSPYADGDAQFTQRTQSGSTVSTIWTQSRVDGLDQIGAFSHAVIANGPCGGTCVQITLGAPFFGNAANDVILLRFGLSTSVWVQDLVYANIPFGDRPVETVLSDYASTFRMVGLQALDANGNDITASSGLSFASMTRDTDPPVSTVPEPATVVLLGAGLAALGALRHRTAGRTSRRASRRTPASRARASIDDSVPSQPNSNRAASR